MTSILDRLLQAEALNFVLTNRIPRKWLTRWVGRISKSEHPWISRSSIALWRAFAEVDLSQSETCEFKSMHECFTRRLVPGARPIDADAEILTSPCDGIVGACGRIDDLTLVQAKRHTYTLQELIGDAAFVENFRNGCYATLRLTSGMYHRFHAPYDGQVTRVTYFSGDVWNVNPPALSRVTKLFCQNERAVLRMRLEGGEHTIALVPVAAVLVASIRLHFLDVLLHLDYQGPHVLECETRLQKGEEMGWFEHGSTIIVLAPPAFRLASEIRQGVLVRMGSPLMTMAGG